MANDNKEHKEVVVRSAIKITSKMYDDLNMLNSLCVLAEFHAEAKEAAKTMAHLFNLGQRLVERKRKEYKYTVE